ncbi:MAG: hypothetical protein ACRDKT_07835 [Actinomycetota bacterium]
MIVLSGSLLLAAGALALVVGFLSIHKIDATQIGLVKKRVSLRKLQDDDPIAFNGEAGYQAELLMPGLRFKLWPRFGVTKYPWVQVPAGEVGVVIAQVGKPLAIGAKSATYKRAFGNFSHLAAFMSNGGEKGVQRPVLPPGTLVPIHPVAFMVLTASAVYGMPVSPDLQARVGSTGRTVAGVVRAARGSAQCHRDRTVGRSGSDRHSDGARR